MRAGRWKAPLAFLGIFTAATFLIHSPYLALPLYWDELGYFVPAALDLLDSGRLIPVSTEPNAHPPLVMAYLAGVWKAAGYSITSTRAAMLLLAGLALMAAFLLAVELSRQLPGAPAFLTMLFLLVSPLVCMQSMMAQLDMPAMLFTALALWLFLKERYRAAAIAATALVLVKETGIAAPLVMGLWLARERNRAALWFLLPLAALAGWFGLLWHTTGHVFGSEKFTGYNLGYPLHPFRLAVSLLKRLYTLFIADFHWLGTAAILYSRKLFRGRAWSLALWFTCAHVALVIVLGGAQLERYLLPVLPVFYTAAAGAWFALGPKLRFAGASAMAAGLLAGLWWNPPYPFPYENNLAMTTFVELQLTAANYLERTHPGVTITTAWPLSDALRRPEFGYVRQGRRVREIPDFQPRHFDGIQEMDVLVLYSREWRRVPLMEQMWHKHFGYAPPIDSEECQDRYGLRPVARWESRGQWIEILVREPSSQRTRTLPI